MFYGLGLGHSFFFGGGVTIQLNTNIKKNPVDPS